MQHVDANDFMTRSAKAAVDTAMRDAKTQVIGGTGTSSPEGTRPMPAAAQPARGPSR